jgi:predicted ATPase/DNA-binding SARP family transcriptional activator
VKGIALHALGALRVEVDGAPVSIERRKALALLVYLAVTRQTHSRESLMALLWDELDASRAAGYLRTMLWTLTKTLGTDWLDADRENVGVRADADIWTDVESFRALVATPTDSERYFSALTEAVALYRGDFLSGFSVPDSPGFDDWLTFETANLRREYATALEDLACIHGERGEFQTAIALAQRWLALDPLQERAHRVLMRLYDRAGQRSAAIRQFKDCAEALKRDLDVEPDRETVALYETILEGRAPTPSLRTQEIRPPIPSARFSAAAKGNIPQPGTPFIGRAREIEDIERLLRDPDCRLLSLIGQGGIGKTRLSMQVGVRAIPAYPDGVYFVPLAPIASQDYIVQAIANAAGLGAFRQGSEPKAQLLDYLAEKHMLLVMDNFEHLLDGADLLAEMLARAPRLKFLVTSRERLRLHEEWVYEIQGMPYPDSAADLDGYDSVELFMQTARRARADFALHDADTPAVIRICQLVQGMPLGVELAAAWIGVLSPAEIAAEIDDSLDFLSTEFRNLPQRHRSMRAVFESSWERLTSQERSTMAALAVTRGGFDRDAAQAIASAAPRLLLQLTEKSFLRRTANGRYEIHELLRQFAEDKLDADERERVLERHGVYFAAFLRGKVEAVKTPAQIEALDAIERDIDNIRLAWNWALTRRNLRVLKDMLPGLILFYTMRSHFQEGNDLFGRAVVGLEDGALTEDDGLIAALVRLGQAMMCASLNRYEQMRRLIVELLPVVRAAASLDPFFVTFVAWAVLWPLRDREEGERWLERAQVAHEAIGDRWSLSVVYVNKGDIAHHFDVDYAESQRWYARALTISREIGDAWGETGALKNLGEVAFSLGDYPEAERLYRDGLALAERMGDRSGFAGGADRLALMLSAQGKYAEAEAWVRRSLDVATELGSRDAQAWGLWALSDIALTTGLLDEARQGFERCFRELDALDFQDMAAWSLLYLSRIDLISGDLDHALQQAQRGLERVMRTENRWARSAALYTLGEAELALGKVDDARDHLIASLRVAWAQHSVNMALRHLVGAARLLANEGNPLRAVELLSLVMRHHAAFYESKLWAQRLLDELRAELPADEIDVAYERGAALRLNEVIEAFIAEPDEAHGVIRPRT